MSIKILLLLLGLTTLIWAHQYAPDQETAEDEKASFYSFRFATTMTARNDTMVNLYIHQERDDEGTLIDLHNKAEIRDLLKTASIVYVMFTGHPSSDSIEPFGHLREALMQPTNVFVITVFIDWTLHKITYIDAMELANHFGKHAGTTLQTLQVDPEKYHFFAHCAGAEVATYALERMFQVSQARIPRISVFDPYVSNRTKFNEIHRFIDFVDVYHAGIYDPPLAPTGTVDFYPNGGVKQPGCQTEDRLLAFVCHHRRSIYLYAESVVTKVNAIETKFDPNDENLLVLGQPKIAPFGHSVNQLFSGSFFLPTGGQAPYLIDLF